MPVEGKTLQMTCFCCCSPLAISDNEPACCISSLKIKCTQEKMDNDKSDKTDVSSSQ